MHSFCAWDASRPAASGTCSSRCSGRERTECDDPATGNTKARRQSRPTLRDLSISRPWVTVARVLLNLDEFVTRE